MDLIRRLPARGDRDDVTLEDVARCARPIHFETDDDAFRYWGNGTGFFASLGDDWFLFAPAHVVHDATPGKISVLPTDGAQRWVTINRQVTGRSVDPDDADLVDARCFRIDTSDLRIPPDETMRAVDFAFPIGSPQPGDRLLIAGYPGVSRDVDYDLHRIKVIGRTIEGRYVGMSVSKRCHELELTELDGIDDLDGFSGSPVFLFTDLRADTATVRFAGMMLRGNAAFRRAHFLEARVLLTFARAIRTGTEHLLSADS